MLSWACTALALPPHSRPGAQGAQQFYPQTWPCGPLLIFLSTSQMGIGVQSNVYKSRNSLFLCTLTKSCISWIDKNKRPCISYTSNRISSWKTGNVVCSKGPKPLSKTLLTQLYPAQVEGQNLIFLPSAFQFPSQLGQTSLWAAPTEETEIK